MKNHASEIVSDAWKIIFHSSKTVENAQKIPYFMNKNPNKYLF
ncbi:hypothetical protein BH10ACI1_BH10ACI1_16390 [soil metagenome]